MNTEKFSEFEGDLYKGGKVFREKHSYTFSHIENTHQLRATIRAGGFVFPGGYRLFFITSDSAALCFECAKSGYRNISGPIRSRASDGWRVEACAINYENGSLYCDNCNKQIEAAHGEAE